MPVKDERYHSIFIVNHWILAFLIFASLGAGWYGIYIADTNRQISDFFLDIHTSIGITLGFLVLLQIVMRVILKQPPYPDDIRRSKRILLHSLYFFIYASLVLLLGSGYLQAVFSGSPIEFWGIRIPNWGKADLPAAEFLGRFWGAPLRIWGIAGISTAAFFGAIHDRAALLLAGLIIVHMSSVAINIYKRPGIAARMLISSPQRQEDEGQAEPSIPSNIGQGLAKHFRLFGWIQFWLQLVFVIFTALLLEFSTSGRAFSPGEAGFGDAIYWGADGFLLLLLAVFMAFYYTRAARRIASRPALYLSKSGLTAFWFLFTGLLTGLLGVIVSFTGVALSISLLIVKTVSQPPGIAITDPSKIIRALDVFILLINFNLLMAHFIGAGIALWLGLGVSSARLRYLTAMQQHILPAERLSH